MKRRKTVLLADDSDEFRWLMWKISEDHGRFSMMTVGSGRDVLLSVQKHTPDLLLIDTVLPDICGLAVLEELRRQGYVPKTIFLSSIASEHIARKALDLGALHFVTKPFHAGKLFDMMYRLLHSCPQHPPLLTVIRAKSRKNTDAWPMLYCRA